MPNLREKRNNPETKKFDTDKYLLFHELNPLSTKQEAEIIKSSIPENGMRHLLGLSPHQFTLFKTAEQWIKKH